MPTVTNTEKDPGGNPQARAMVRVRLITTPVGAAPGYVAASDFSVAGDYTVRTDGSGAWAIPLVANELIDPANSYYLAEVQPRVGQAIRHKFLVPDGAGPYRVEDNLVDPPASMPTLLSEIVADVAAAMVVLDASAVKVNGGGKEAVVVIASADTAATLDLSLGNVFDVSNPVAGGTCTLTLAGATDGKSCGCTVFFHQRSSGDSGLAFTGTVVPMNDGELPGPALDPDGVATYSLVTLDGGATIYAWKVGDSATSAPDTVPGPPTGLVATRGNAQASVAFTPPVSTGGTTITGYTVTSSPGGFTATGASSPIVVTGLTNGTSYTFTAHATNAIGDSVESSASSAVTPATVPGAPTIGTSSFGNTTATANWSAPGSNGGSAITGYVVKLYRASDNVELASATPGNVSTHQFTGLTNGVGVYAKAAAINVIGTGSQSAASNTVTPATGPTVPGAPTIGTATAGNAQATANWTAPGSDGGSAITGYEVKTYDSSGTLLDTDTVGVVLTFVNTSVANDVAVKFKVAAINAIGTGSQSAFSNTVTPTAPGFSDNFNRANASPLGNGWVNIGSSIANVAAVVSNQAKITFNAGGMNIWAHETSMADGTVSVEAVSASAEVGWVFRAADANNWVSVSVRHLVGEYRIQSCVAGVVTNEHDVSQVFPSLPFTLSAVLAGNSITLKVNGTDFLTGFALPGPVHTALGANTKHGFGAGVFADTTNSIYDNFTATP